MRRLRLMFLVLLLPILVGGCAFLLDPGPTPTAELTPSATTIVTPTLTLTPTATPRPQPALVTLKLWLPEELDPYGERPGATLIAQRLAQFSQAAPDLQVDTVVKKAQGRGGLLDFLRAARDAAPSVLPDVIVLRVEDLKTVAGSGLIEPLDAALTPEQLSDRLPYATTLGGAQDPNGESATMGAVFAANAQHAVYDQTAIQSPPVSWTDVVSPPVSFLFPAAGQAGRVDEATLIQYLAAGGKLVDTEGAPALDEEPLIDVLTFYSDSVGTEAISPTIVTEIDTVEQSWARFDAGQGDIAAVDIGLYLQAITSGETTEASFAAASLPTDEGHPFTIAHGKWAIALVTEDPERQAQAVQLLEFLIAPEFIGPWSQTAGYLPGTRSALRQWEIPDAQKVALLNLMEAAVPPPAPDVLAAIGPPMQEAVESVLSGAATPEQAARLAVDQLR